MFSPPTYTNKTAPPRVSVRHVHADDVTAMEVIPTFHALPVEHVVTNTTWVPLYRTEELHAFITETATDVARLLGL